jgi:hypothetical protein
MTRAAVTIAVAVGPASAAAACPAEQLQLLKDTVAHLGNFAEAHNSAYAERIMQRRLAVCVMEVPDSGQAVKSKERRSRRKLAN